MATTKKKAAEKKATAPATKKATAPAAKKATTPANKKAAAPAAKKATTPAAKKAAPKKAAAKKAAAPAAPAPTTVNVYISYNGNCEQAFKFYKSVFGGEFGYVGRYKEMPPMEGQPPMPASAGKKIMHISLPISKETSLMGCDMISGMGQMYTAGNNFMVSINAGSKAEADRLFKGLSKGGKVIMPMANTFWGSYFGMFGDKFGIQWMVSYDGGQSK